jgi:putative NADH-flavin reductase
MKITVIAATGGIGRQVLDQALTGGHEVTAVARRPEALDAEASRGARVVTADLATATAADLEKAVDAADAVLSGLGRRSASDGGIAQRGTRVLVDAMTAVGARRLVVVSAAPIGTVPSPARPHPPRHDPGDAFLVKYLAGPLIKRVLRAGYADLAAMEDLLRASELDWTAVRPPRLVDKPLTRAYRTAYGENLRRGMSISRADVAHFMLRVAEDPVAIKQVVGIAY